MEKWSETAWQAAAPVYDKITEHPFIKELTDGTLDRSRFMHYLRQDSLYIGEYFRVLAHIASRLRDSEFASDFIGFAADGVFVEKTMHEVYLKDEPMTAGVRMSPACELYTSVLKAQSYMPVEVEAAAVLPCFWVYQRVGERIYTARDHSANPYKAWIDTYGDPAFAESNRRAIAICDALAEQTGESVRRAMTDIFVKATRLEWLFWDSAYRKEVWPI